MNQTTDKPRALRDTLIERINAEMHNNSAIMFLCADFGSPALDKLRDEFPDRFINVGIAEQNMVNVATGLALEGHDVFAYAIATFITMRCYEQVRVNLAVLGEVRDRLNVNLIGVGTGTSYDVSGPSHHCMEDLPIMRILPNFKIASPCDHRLSGKVVDWALAAKHPKYIRLDSKPLAPLYENPEEADFARGFSELRSGGDVCLLSTGFMTHKCMTAAEELAADGIQCGVVDFYTLKGFDEQALKAKLGQYKIVLTAEEGFSGGMDAIILKLLAESGMKVSSLNVPDFYTFELGGRELIHEKYGIGKVDIIRRVRSLLS